LMEHPNEAARMGRVGREYFQMKIRV